jgi:hypothetical protein
MARYVEVIRNTCKILIGKPLARRTLEGGVDSALSTMEGFIIGNSELFRVHISDVKLVLESTNFLLGLQKGVINHHDIKRPVFHSTIIL